MTQAQFNFLGTTRFNAESSFSLLRVRSRTGAILYDASSTSSPTMDSSSSLSTSPSNDSKHHRSPTLLRRTSTIQRRPSRYSSSSSSSSSTCAGRKAHTASLASFSTMSSTSSSSSSASTSSSPTSPTASSSLLFKEPTAPRRISSLGRNSFIADFLSPYTAPLMEVMEPEFLDSDDDSDETDTVVNF
ncbi:hypothetical protein DFS34DRAFT_616926 [Phlyctochytrium arcticum]|nr:hypothetical protein DFS34DRAFT_616926 [Phlyctochytrium arcticum]